MGSVSKIALPNDRVIPVQLSLANEYGVGAALLIQQVHFWCSNRPNIRDGHEWVYNTHEAWAQQLGCSERKIRYIVKELKDKGVLIVANHNERKYDRTQWYRVNYDALVGKEETAAPIRQNLPLPSGNICHMLPAEIAAPIPKINSEKSNLGLTSTAPDGTDASTPVAFEKDKTGEKKSDKLEELMNLTMKQLQERVGLGELTMATAKEIMARQADRNKEKHGLPIIWKNTLYLLTGQTQAGLTLKQHGQLKMFGKRVGDDAEKVLKYVLNDWGKFYVEAKFAGGLPFAPTQPDVGFLLKHCNIALAMYLQSIAKPHIGVPASAAAQTPKVQPAPAEEKATKEQIAAALAEFM